MRRCPVIVQRLLNGKSYRTTRLTLFLLLAVYDVVFGGVKLGFGNDTA